jgi:hypothetical protein
MLKLLQLKVSYSQLNNYYDTENEWLFTEDNFEYTDKTNTIIANRLDSNRDFTDLITGNLTGSINIIE